MTLWLWTLASVLLVSMTSLIAAVSLAWSEASFRRASILLVAFAAGALYGDAFIHLIPESLERTASGRHVTYQVLAGVFAMFVLEKLLRRRTVHVHRHGRARTGPLVKMNLLGDGLHNLLDGMLIGASYAAGTTIGVATTIAVLLHEVPQELGDLGVLVRGGLSPRRAILFNLLSALAALVGAVLALAIGLGAQAFADALLPVTAGVFIYLAGSDLIPELMHERFSWPSALAQTLCIAAGVGAMAMLP